jgi:hypothetical protein
MKTFVVSREESSSAKMMLYNSKKPKYLQKLEKTKERIPSPKHDEELACEDTVAKNAYLLKVLGQLHVYISSTDILVRNIETGRLTIRNFLRMKMEVCTIVQLL